MDLELATFANWLAKVLKSDLDPMLKQYRLLTTKTSCQSLFKQLPAQRRTHFCRVELASVCGLVLHPSAILVPFCAPSLLLQWLRLPPLVLPFRILTYVLQLLPHFMEHLKVRTFLSNNFLALRTHKTSVLYSVQCTTAHILCAAYTLILVFRFLCFVISISYSVNVAKTKTVHLTIFCTYLILLYSLYISVMQYKIEKPVHLHFRLKSHFIDVGFLLTQ